MSKFEVDNEIYPNLYCYCYRLIDLSVVNSLAHHDHEPLVVKNSNGEEETAQQSYKEQMW